MNKEANNLLYVIALLLAALLGSSIHNGSL